MAEENGNYTQYTADGTYWTGRKRGRDYVEVVRVRSSDYGVVENFGTYRKTGAAVAAAAKLAYAQGWKDAQAELTRQVHEALAGVGLGAVVVEKPDVSSDEVEDLPVEDEG